MSQRQHFGRHRIPISTVFFGNDLEWVKVGGACDVQLGQRMRTLCVIFVVGVVCQSSPSQRAPTSKGVGLE